MFLFFVFTKHFILQPWYISTESAVKVLCRGWSCGSSKDNLTMNDKLTQVIQSYRNKSLEGTLAHSLLDLTLMGSLPAISASGFCHLLGIGDFQYDPKKSLEILEECASAGYWSCHEHLAFHPLCKNNTFHLVEAAKLGSVYAMQKLTFELIHNGKFEDASEYLYQLLYASSSNWFHKRRAGLDYAYDVKSILLKDKNSDKSWQDLKRKAKKGHLPSLLWIFDGFISGKYRNTTAEEISLLSETFVENGSWKYDISDIVKSKDNFSKIEAISYLSKIGDQSAAAYESYPDFYQ